ncbi:reticulocyte-binding protein homolog 2b [Patella vulgata]|uniref:reticulocyte-binding protein homolog 2b n=1 Tax=Patella vulgata TaxID=6465 RepID=UPI0024A7AA0E|nr:reticulocyte-binding protein homolog 2b [Patella vulgata]XP_055954409.1 reticulocyte-binding protein homolog 2b [Patella vulgata]
MAYSQETTSKKASEEGRMAIDDMAEMNILQKVNTTCKITNLPDAVAIEERKGLIFTVTGETSNNQPLKFKWSWDPEEAEQYFTLHPEYDELRVHVTSDSVFTCNCVTLTVTVNDGMSDSLPANLEIVKAEVRLILIGKTGVGKSALGNSLLDLSLDTRFLSKSSAASVTSCNSCKHCVREVDGDKYLFKILDTPGLLDTKISHQNVKNELAKCMIHLAPGPHIFSFILPIDRIDGHVMETVEKYKELFGECLEKFGVIIFTKKDALDGTFDEYLEDVKPEFKEFLEGYCGNRYSLIDNKNPRPDDVNGILSLLLKTKRNNNGKHYRDAMFEEAKKLYEDKLQQKEDEKTKVERELKQQLHQKERELKQHFKLKEEQERELKQQLKLKEEQLKQRESEFTERENELEATNNKFQIMVREFAAREKEFKEREKEFDEMNNKLQNMEKENKALNLQNQTLLEEHNKKSPSDQETDVNSVTNPQPQIAEMEKSKQTVDIQSVGFETLSNPSGQEIDLKTATDSQQQIAELEKLRQTVNIQNVDFVKLCSLLLQDGCLNEKDKEDIVSSESSSSMDTLMDKLNKTNNNNKAYIIVINHLKSGTTKETNNTTQDYDAKYKQKLNGNRRKFMSVLADHIQDLIARLREKWALQAFEAKAIQKVISENNPEVGISSLIDVLCEREEVVFNKFKECLREMGYNELVDDFLEDTDDTDDHLPIDEESRGLTIPDDVNYNQTSVQNNNMATTSITPVLHQPFVMYENNNTTQDAITTKSNKTTDKNIINTKSIYDTCRYGTLDEVNSLINKNIDLNNPDDLGLTPVFYCVHSKIKPLEKVKLLYSSGARLDVKTRYDGRNILHYACQFSTTDCLEYLLEVGLDKDGRDGGNRTPVFYCVRSEINPVEKVKLLSSAGAMLDVKSDDGNLLDWARMFGKTECESFLREIGL